MEMELILDLEMDKNMIMLDRVSTLYMFQQYISLRQPSFYSNIYSENSGHVLRKLKLKTAETIFIFSIFLRYDH